MEAALDHLVIASTDLGALRRWWADQVGTAPEPGGAHTGRGTRNYLAGINANSYVELIGPDSDQPDPSEPRPFGIDQMDSDSIRLVTCALAVADIDAAVLAVREAGIDPGEPFAMSRVRPDGVELIWKLAVPPDLSLGGAMPFLIEWGTDTPHPAADLASVVRVSRLTLHHPDIAPIARALGSLGADITTAQASIPSVSAQLITSTGQLSL